MIIKPNYHKIVTLLTVFILTVISSYAQDIEKQERIANTQMREGNELYQNAKFADAEVAYKKSVATYPGNPKAIYNLANAMMQQKRYKEAIAQYNYLAKSSKSNKMKAQAHHNIGNAQMGLNDFQKAVDAYKNSLRKNPFDEETRYNLALAQELLKQQQDQNQDQDNQDKQNKDDKNKDKENKDQDKKDDKNKDNKDQKDKDKEGDDKDDKKDSEKEKKEDEKEGDKEKDKEQPKDDKQQNGDNKDQQKEQQPQPGQLSKQQMEQLLKALQNEEKKTQDKVNAKKVKGKPVKTEKDW